jgi:hypothetical protein
VGLPETPSESDTVIPVPPVTRRVVQASEPVLVTIPVEDNASTAARSSAKASVGFPDTPFPFETVIPAAGCVNVLPLYTPEPSADTNPVVVKFIEFCIGIISPNFH